MRWIKKTLARQKRCNIYENIAQIVTGCFQASGWPGVVSVMANWFGKVNIELKETIDAYSISQCTLFVLPSETKLYY